MARSYTRPSVGLSFVGATALAEAFNMIVDAGKKARGEWWVVTVVNYAELLEAKRPHWRVALQSVADEIDVSRKEQEKALNAMMAGGNLTREMAIRLSNRIERLIISHNLIDTGNYLASIAIGATMDEALENSIANLVLPETSVLVIT